MDSLSPKQPTKKTKAAVAEVKNKDEATLLLIQEVQKRKQEILEAEKPAWKTHCSLRHPLTGNTHNLHVESSLHVLMSLVVELTLRQEAWERTCANWGTHLGDYQIQNHAIKDWLHDLALRITKVQLTAKKSQLETLEARLNAIISPELRAQLELEAIQKELNFGQ